MMELRHKCPTLLLVVPCYNEEEVLPTTSELYLAKVKEHISLGNISPDSGILFIDDGSKDSTWEIICNLSQEHPEIRGAALSRNRGHQHALLAGLMEARGICDVTISIDADGQDDIDAVDDMLAAYADGCDIVYGVRSSRETDSFFKRTTAQGFYRVMDAMGVETVYNHADYRLLSKRALDELANYEEVNLFLRGMVPLVGFKSTSVYYERHERIAGESHYPLAKMVALAVDGITSMSVKPIRLIFFLGLLLSMAGIIGFVWQLIALFLGRASSAVCIVLLLLLLHGIELTAIGTVGEYIGKTYLESKHRPRWAIKERVGRETA